MVEPSKIRVVIVDDEHLARKKIQNLLKNDSEIEVVGECSNGTEAVNAVRAQRPDLLFWISRFQTGRIESVRGSFGS